MDSFHDYRLFEKVCNAKVLRNGIGRTPYSNKSKIIFIMSKTVKIGRDAETGKFVSIPYALKHPSTTVIEKVKVGPTKHRK